MKRCKCEHWQICPTCYPQGFDEQGVRKPVEIPPSREELQRDIVSIREQVEKWKSLHESLTKLNEAQERRHEKQVEKLTDECVVLRASSRSKLETISSLELQVEKLTKERDTLKTMPMKYRRMQFNAELQEDVRQQEQQLAALAEQNEKLRKVLLRLACLGNGDQYGNSIGNCIAQEALSLPDLATPILNRIRAEGVRKASTLVSLVRNDWASAGDNLSVQAAEYLIYALDARAAELEKTNG